MDILLMKFGSGIHGECRIAGYEDAVEVLSFSHGVSQPVSGDASSSSRTAGRPQHQDFTFTKYLDMASPGLIDCCNQATNLPVVTFVAGESLNGAVEVYWTVQLSNVLISSVSVGGGGGKPMETITLNYTAIQWDYKRQTDAGGTNGTNSCSWDLAANLAANKAA